MAGGVPQAIATHKHPARAFLGFLQERRAENAATGQGSMCGLQLQLSKSGFPRCAESSAAQSQPWSPAHALTGISAQQNKPGVSQMSGWEHSQLREIFVPCRHLPCQNSRQVPTKFAQIYRPNYFKFNGKIRQNFVAKLT